jgi:tetratricopeptide (TPR) repeat protein
MYAGPNAQAANADQKLAKADDLFKNGRYWDAFSLYKQISSADGAYLMKRLEDSKTCMVLKHKYEVNRGLKNYPRAIKNLEELMEINPADPSRPDLGIMAYIHAGELQQKAYYQQYRIEAELKLKEASAYYRKALQEGISSEEVFPKLKLCEKQLRIVDSSLEFEIKEEPIFTEDLQKIEPSLPIERTRKVLILDKED